MTPTLAIVIGISVMFGYGAAEILHRVGIRRQSTRRRRNDLIAEFYAKQLWQFISIDEWLKGKQ